MLKKGTKREMSLSLWSIISKTKETICKLTPDSRQPTKSMCQDTSMRGGQIRDGDDNFGQGRG